MIRVKSIFDPVEADDGIRIWVEPIGLTRDLRQWCDVDYVLPQLGPPLRVWNDLRDHPDHYGYFVAKYRVSLSQSACRATIAELATARQITLLHDGIEPEHNSAAVLFDFISTWQQRAGL